MKTQNKPKVSLIPPSTFTAPVEIRMPGGEIGEINFKFKHRTKSAVKELLASLSAPEGSTDEEREAFVGPKDEDIILDIATGWDLDDAFSLKSVIEMGEMYTGCERAIIQTYLSELSGGRVKN